MRYHITKINIKTGEEFNLGTYDEDDMKLIVRGYHFNGLFYEKKNSCTMYIVDEEPV